MLTKKTYVAVVKAVQNFKERNFDVDRQENPNISPAAYGSGLISIVQDCGRKNHERITDQQAKDTLDYLCSKGILVHYVGDYTFPSDEVLPTRDQLIIEAKNNLRSLEQLYK